MLKVGPLLTQCRASTKNDRLESMVGNIIKLRSVTADRDMVFPKKIRAKIAYFLQKISKNP
jgi:hypothetical protein